MLRICLMRLYPRMWRDRYGDEMEALLEQCPIKFRTLVDLFIHAGIARFDPFFVKRSSRLNALLLRQRPQYTLLWVFPLLAGGYMYLLDGLDDALLDWTRRSPDLWRLKLVSEYAMALSFGMFALIAFTLGLNVLRQSLIGRHWITKMRLLLGPVLALAAMVAAFPVSNDLRHALPAIIVCLPIYLAVTVRRTSCNSTVLKWTRRGVPLILLGIGLHIGYTVVWAGRALALSSRLVTAMALSAQRQIWNGGGWRVQTCAAILWMAVLFSYMVFVAIRNLPCCENDSDEEAGGGHPYNDPVP